MGCKNMWLKNVRMETGFDNVKDRGMVTKTELKCIQIKNGKISKIIDQVPADAQDILDAKEYLLLPSLRDNHIHLDKGLYGGHWQAVVPANGVRERIKEEEGFLEDFLPDTPKKAQALIDLICDYGATFLRVQVNIDPVIEMKNLDIVQEVLEKNKHRLDYEIVAFPQHGTIYTEETGLLSKAATDLRIGIMGGVDPATLDLDIEKSLRTTFTIARDNDLQVDIHLHDGGSLGIYEINRILDYTKEYNMQGKVEISHAYSMGDVSEEVLLPIVKRLAEENIDINTTVPIDTPAPPIPFLQKNGVKVHVVNDNINDHWSPFGTGDMIERASRAAEVSSLVDEVSLSRTLGLVTNGVTPLDNDGNQVWPKEGDAANFLFTTAESSAHLIARVVPERVVMFKGKIVAGEFK